jgi:hypothetical protein
MKAIVKKDFDYSGDGISIIRLRKGETHEIADSLIDGLLEEGFIDRVETKKKDEKKAADDDKKSEATDPSTQSQKSVQSPAPPPPPRTVPAAGK